MSKSDSKKGMRLDMPASYSIDIQGYIDASWSDRLAGAISAHAKGRITHLPRL